jgi:hypothetical protein
VKVEYTTIAPSASSQYALRKLQRGLSVIETWCERWNLEISEEAQAICFSYRRRPPDAHLSLSGRNILFVSDVRYLGAIFDKRITWRLLLEMIEAKAFRTFTRIHSLFKSKRLSTGVKLTFHKALIRLVMTFVFPTWEFPTDT